MGVDGDYLSHPTIRIITDTINLKDYNGKTGAIDTSRFLYAGFKINPSALAKLQHEGLVEGGRDAELAPVLFAVKQMMILKTSFGITPFAVIDGPPLPTKERENAERQKKET